MRRFLLLSASLSALVFGFGAAASAQMKPVVDDAKPSVEKKVEEVVKQGKEKAADVVEAVKDEAKEVAKKVEEKTAPAVEAAKKKTEEVVEAVEEKAEAVTETVKEETKEVVKAAEEKVEDAKEAVKEEKAEETKDAAPAKTPVLPNFTQQAEPEAKAEEAKEAAPEAAATPEMPAEAPKTLLADAVSKDGDVETFVELLKLAGMEAVLSDTAMPHTLFVPTDSAFSDMESKVLDELRKPENKDKLADFLNFHIVNGKITRQALDNNSSEVLTATLKRLRVVGEKGKLTVNGIAVDEKDVEVDNGVVFKIDAVITAEAERVTVAPVGTTPAAPQTDAVATGGGMPDTSRLAPADGAEFVPAPPQTPPATAVEGDFKGEKDGEKAQNKAWYKFW